MSFSRWLHARRHLLVKLVGAVVVAIAAGAAIGLAAGALTKEDKPAAATPRAADVRVQVVSAILHPAATARGRARQRGRLSVHARVTNGGSSTLTFARPQLQSGANVLDVDAHGVKPGGALLRPIAAGATADGVLRYETAGAVTRRLMSSRRVALRIAGRTVRVKVIPGSPARPSG